MAGINLKNNKSYIISFLLIKYLDYITYDRIFNYLSENYHFKPKIIHSDFEKAIEKAIKSNKYFDDSLIHSRCFFHYGQMVRKKLYESGIFKKKFNRNGYEILSNIEILCFIDMNNIDKFKKIIIDNLKKYDKIDNFIKYLNNYLFKLPHQIYNYSQLIKYFAEKNDLRFINKLYTTNNIVESINSILAFNLPKRVTQNIDFIKSITKILSIESLDIKNSKRKDYKTKALLYLIKEEDLNKNLKWISVDMFKKYLNLIIEKENDNMDEIEIKKLIESYTNILCQEGDDSKKEDTKSSGNKSADSSEEEINKIVNEKNKYINDDLIEEFEEDDINISSDNFDIKDEQKIIDNIISLMDNCKIDNNIDSKELKMKDNKKTNKNVKYKNESEKDKNKEGSSSYECLLNKENSEDINENIGQNWFKKNLKERVSIKKKENKRKNISIKKYKYPKDD